MKRYHSRMTPGTPAHPRHDLAQAVFHSVYSSREQRQRRFLAALLLTAKHTLRGLLFSWPLYLVIYAGFRIDAPLSWLLWALGIPGVVISVFILMRGIREEYRHRVQERLLSRFDLARLLRGGMA